MSEALVRAVCRSAAYSFTKPVVPTITLVTGLGVEGDVHSGTTVRHRSRIARNPDAPNLRQIHLIHTELLEELTAKGFRNAAPGALGENVTTKGLDLLALSRGTRLRLGNDAEIEITGLRNPCSQLDAFEPGLMAAVLGRSAEGELIRKAGVMAIVLAGGMVRAGDQIRIVHAPPVTVRLAPV
jgi:MOSC domain-containing protein YiiM